jgi:hypothetical protein
MNLHGLPHLVSQNSDQYCLELMFRDRSALALQGAQPPVPYLVPAQTQPIAISVQVPPVFTQVITTTLLIWLTSGHGECHLFTEPYKQDKQRVNFKSGTSYIHYIEQRQVEALADWCEQVLAVIRSQPRTQERL